MVFVCGHAGGDEAGAVRRIAARAGALGRGAVAAAIAMAATTPPAASAQQMANAAASLVFDGVTVVDVEQGKLRPAQRVVIVGNRIQTMGDASAVKTPKGAQIVDARGKYLIPGLWDIHVHPQELATDVFYPLFIANGVTGIRDAGSEVSLDNLIQWRREILAGTRVGPPRQILSGAAIDQWPSCKRRGLTEDLVNHVCVTANDSADARLLIAQLRAAGADMIKTYRLSRNTYFAIAAAARRAGIPFGGHVVAWPEAEVGPQDPAASAIEASDSGARTISHVNSAGGLDTLCVGPAASVERCRPVAERFRRNNTWWVLTLTQRLSFNGAKQPNPGQAARDLVGRFQKFASNFWAKAVRPDNGLRDSLQATIKHRATDAPPASPGFLDIAHRVGLPLLAGTDARRGGRDLQPPGFSLHEELAIYVAEGLTPLAALQAATLNPAQMWRATDSLGTVAPGKLADLVLLDADPLADITNTTTIRAVVANGRYFDRAALDGLVAEVQTNAELDSEP